MATTWGTGEGSGNLHYVGIDYDLNSAGTTLTVYYYVKATYSVDDDQTLNLTGAITGSVDYRKDGPGTQLIATRSRSVSKGNSYTVGANASDIYNGGTPSHSRTINVPADPPSKPDPPEVDNATTTGFRASWDAPANNGASIDEYEYERVTVTTGYSATNTTTARSVTFTGLVAGYQYKVRVRAHNSAGWSSWSSYSDTITLDGLPPDAPGGTAASLDAGRARLTWNAAATNGSAVTGYQVQRALNSAFTSGAVSTTVSAATRGYTFTTATDPGDTVYMRVRANSGAGYGPWSVTRSQQIPAEPPDAPPNAALTVSGFEMTLTWGAAPTNGTAVTGYEIQVRSASQSWTEATTYSRSASTRSFVYSDGLAGETYFMRVRANSAAGYGPFTSPLSGVLSGGLWVKVGGVWKLATVWVRVGGAWKQATPYAKVGGVWRS